MSPSDQTIRSIFWVSYLTVILFVVFALTVWRVL